MVEQHHLNRPGIVAERHGGFHRRMAQKDLGRKLLGEVLGVMDQQVQVVRQPYRGRMALTEPVRTGPTLSGAWSER